jgi:hypothetical protein
MFGLEEIRNSAQHVRALLTGIFKSVNGPQLGAVKSR